jgi:hypothetical protein
LRPGFHDRLGAKRRFFANRFIDVAAGLGLARGRFQGALTGGEFALRQVQIAGAAAAARAAGA